MVKGSINHESVRKLRLVVTFAANIHGRSLNSKMSIY